MVPKGIWKIVSSVAYFSREPLNFETFSQRLERFRQFKVTADSNTLIDCIRASREIQKNASFDSSKQKDNFLGIRTHAMNTEKEGRLWEFLQEHKKTFIQDERVVREYLLNNSVSVNVKDMFEVAIGSFKHELTKGSANNAGFRISLNILLARKDYYNSMELIDRTYSSPDYLSYTKMQIAKTFSIVTGSGLLVSIAEYALLPMAPLSFWMVMNLSACGVLAWGFLRIHTPFGFYRINWRPYNSMLHRYIYRKELELINKVILHFEEHNEVNIRNFHHSKVRKPPDLSTVSHQHYIISIPDYPSTRARSSSEYENHENIKLQKFFRQELQKRKMVINELEDELMFLDFWLSHGERYTWTEPDQDPAEIIELDIKHN